MEEELGDGIDYFLASCEDFLESCLHRWRLISLYLPYRRESGINPLI